MVIEKDMTQQSTVNMIKRYRHHSYKHPETGEVFRDLREDSDMERPYKAPDGIMCPRKPKPGEGASKAPSIGRKDNEPPLRPVHIKF